MIDALCDFYPGYSREQWLEAIATGEIQSPIAIKESLQSRPVSAEQTVRDGERFLQRMQNYVEPKINPEIELVYEDAAIVVLNKCAPLPMHPSGRFNLNTLECILDAAYYPDKLRSAHRLDANTTGLVVYARKYSYSQFLQSQFTDGTVDKVYLATVVGHPDWDEIECDLAISKEAAPGGGRRIDVNGAPASTRFRVLSRQADNTTLIEARPLTGRTHQIRLHLSSLGFPIVNDPLYLPGGVARVEPDPDLQNKPMGLHSHRLSFVHPVTKLRISFGR